MKKLLKYAGFCSLLLAVVAFILMLATPAIVNKSGNLQVTTDGVVAIFGKTERLLGVDVVTKPSPMALIAWILALAGLLIVLCGIVLPLLKVKGFTKFAGILNLVAVGCFVVAGIFMFITIPSFYSANDSDVPSTALLGAGWIIGAILYIVAGVVAVLPAFADFLSKK